MAKRRKHHTSHRRHHRRIGAAGAGLGHDFMEVVGLVAGSVVATIAQRQLTTMNPKLISGGELVGGWMLKKNARSPFMLGLGWGVLGAGAIGLTHEVGLIQGVEDYVSGMYGGDGQGYIEDSSMVHGLSNEHTVGGLRNEAMMAGDDERRTFDPLYDM